MAGDVPVRRVGGASKLKAARVGVHAPIHGPNRLDHPRSAPIGTCADRPEPVAYPPVAGGSSIGNDGDGRGADGRVE